MRVAVVAIRVVRPANTAVQLGAAWRVKAYANAVNNPTNAGGQKISAYRAAHAVLIAVMTPMLVRLVRSAGRSVMRRNAFLHSVTALFRHAAALTPTARPGTRV